MFSFPSPELRAPSLESTTILARFKRGGASGIDLTLRQPYFDLLAKLGNPQLKFPSVVHVAGTNGKGSTCAFLRAMIEAAGYRAHVYTSPHLVTFHERIRLAGELIDEAELIDILKVCEQYATPGAITYFEAATAAAFVAFARHPADAVILETGLGGRLDATNVIPKPAATVITRLSFDHREYLGTTMDAIAREKAGIMRPGVSCFTARQPSDTALQALKAAAREMRVPLIVGGHDWRVEVQDASTFRFVDSHHTVTLPFPALTGQHQIENAGLALATLSALPFDVPDVARKKAMHTVEWPGRLQKLEHGRLASLLPKGWELWLDGGHNDSAAEALATQLEAWRQTDGPAARPLFLIMGMLSTKTPHEFMTPLLPYVSAWRMVSIENEPLSRAPRDLVNIAETLGIQQVSTSDSLTGAIQNVSHNKEQPGRILICGSLYLVGEALRQNTI